LLAYKNTMPQNAPIANIPSRLPVLTEKLLAPLVPEPEALGSVLLLTSAVGLLGSAVGKTLVIDGVIEPLTSVLEADVELLLVEAFDCTAEVTARCE
jgi:hypothetical protein